MNKNSHKKIVAIAITAVFIMSVFVPLFHNEVKGFLQDAPEVTETEEQIAEKQAEFKQPLGDRDSWWNKLANKSIFDQSHKQILTGWLELS